MTSSTASKSCALTCIGMRVSIVGTDAHRLDRLEGRRRDGADVADAAFEREPARRCTPRQTHALATELNRISAYRLR